MKHAHNFAIMPDRVCFAASEVQWGHFGRSFIYCSKQKSKNMFWQIVRLPFYPWIVSVVLRLVLVGPERGNNEVLNSALLERLLLRNRRSYSATNNTISEHKLVHPSTYKTLRRVRPVSAVWQTIEIFGI